MRGNILLLSTGSSTEVALSWAIGNRPFDLKKATSVDEAMLCLEQSSFDILVCDDDISEGSWLDFLIHVARHRTAVISLVTAQSLSSEVLIRAFNDGRAFAFLPKPVELNKLRFSVDEAMRLSAMNFVARTMFETSTRLGPYRFQAPAPTSSDPDEVQEVTGVTRLFAELPGNLSRREWEVLELLGSGLTTRQIAKRLFISVYTARNHLKNMYRKLEVHSRTELIDWYQAGLKKVV